MGFIGFSSFLGITVDFTDYFHWALVKDPSYLP